MIDYEIQRISCKEAKQYIIANHYSHGCHNGPSPCYGLFEKTWPSKLIGVLMFATPCSEAVRSSVFGPEMKDAVVELHRLHIMDGTPKNTESWFISRCLKLLKSDRPQTKAVISFSDSTQGHKGTIYQATHFYYCGKTGEATFYIDEDGRLRHPRQNGVNITKEQARELGWTPTKRLSKNRYIYILASSKVERKHLIEKCRYELVEDDYENA